MGGGSIPIDPRDSKGVTALDRYFEYEVALPAADDRPFIGQRVHGPLRPRHRADRFPVYRSFRQIFLRLFDV
jgi:putative peptide zinc metalloprotease protein